MIEKEEVSHFASAFLRSLDLRVFYMISRYFAGVTRRLCWSTLLSVQPADRRVVSGLPREGDYTCKNCFLFVVVVVVVVIVVVISIFLDQCRTGSKNEKHKHQNTPRN